MTAARQLTINSHVVDILGSTKGRDQPVMLIEKALCLVSCISEETFLNPDTVFLDPFCKAGEILLASALKSCAVNKGRTKTLASQVEIANEIYGGRYYALSPDERHYFLSRRTFYGNTKSHVDGFAEHIKNGDYVSEIDGRLSEEKFKEEFSKMLEFIKCKNPNSKIIAVGNPPYQEADGGAGSSAKPIYNFFVEQLMNSRQVDEFVLVIPARWFAGGKGLDSFREKVADSKQIRALHYFDRSEDLFPTVHVQGGVCFLHWQRAHSGNSTYVVGENSFDVNLAKFDIIPDDPVATSIIDKVIKHAGKKFVSESAWPRKPFGLPTNFFSLGNHEVPEGTPNSIRCYVKGRKIKFVKRSEVKERADHIDKWKVAIPRAYATGARRCTLPKHQFFILKKGEISTETYNVIDSFETKEEAEKLISYLQTDFARYLLGVRKLTQDIPKDRWAWVPYMSLNKKWTDENLFDFFNLTKQEREHVKKKIQEWS